MALAHIVTAKLEAVARRKQQRPLASFVAALAPSNRSLEQALREPHNGFVLECKRASPSQGVLRQHYDPVAIARAYAPFADAISVLADEPFFGGALEHVAAVREVVSCPVLCKDIVVDAYQLYEARSFGADAVLLMASVLDETALVECLAVARRLALDAIIEVRDPPELELALSLNPAIIGINSRNLATLSVDLSAIERLAPRVPSNVLVLGESGVHTHNDVRRLSPLVDALLVGSSLMRESDVSRAVRRLLFGRVKICGITRPNDAAAAYASGATLGGLVFAAPSPRVVTMAQAHQLCRASELQWAGVFVNESVARVAATAHDLDLAAVQLHGDETSEYVSCLRPMLPPSCEIWKALRVRTAMAAATPQATTTTATGAERLLLDTFVHGRQGGTGTAFDWNLIPEGPVREHMILAGGVAANNVAVADKLGMWALDVSSGVEEAAGIKSHERLSELFGVLRGRGRGRDRDRDRRPHHETTAPH